MLIRFLRNLTFLLNLLWRIYSRTVIPFYRVTKNATVHWFPALLFAYFRLLGKLIYVKKALKERWGYFKIFKYNLKALENYQGTISCRHACLPCPASYQPVVRLVGCLSSLLCFVYTNAWSKLNWKMLLSPLYRKQHCQQLLWTEKKWKFLPSLKKF